MTSLSGGSDCPHCAGHLTRYWKHNGHGLCDTCQKHLISYKYKSRAKPDFHGRKEIHGYYDIFDIIMLDTDKSSIGFLKRLFRMK